MSDQEFQAMIDALIASTEELRQAVQEGIEKLSAGVKK